MPISSQRQTMESSETRDDKSQTFPLRPKWWHNYTFFLILHLLCLFVCLFVCLMVFNATFNNVSVISWGQFLLVEETRGPEENHRPVASHWQTLSHNVVHVALIEIRTHNFSGDMHLLSDYLDRSLQHISA